MDIAAMSIMHSQAKVKQAASLSVAKMVLNISRNNGDALVEMVDSSTKTMENLANPHLGRNIDVVV